MARTPKRYIQKDEIRERLNGALVMIHAEPCSKNCEECRLDDLKCDND